ncbi:hypothetical protein [Thermosulfuriphilus sp.]
MKDLEINRILERYRARPYQIFRVESPHTGRVVRLLVEEGQQVFGPSGRWGERPGSPLYELERERNLKLQRAEVEGTIVELRQELEGRFVEANEYILSIKHPLSRDEIIDLVLKEVLFVITAPERARYYFTSEIAQALEKGRVSVSPGDEILIMSFMKRETPIIYQGEPGVIFKTYFRVNQIVEQGEPLLGIAPEDQLPYIEKIISRIRSEWD